MKSLVCTLVLVLSTVLAAAAAVVPASTDTILPASIVYQGYRIHVRNINVVKQRDNDYLLQFEAINTGRRAVSFGPGFPAHYLQTVFDASLSRSGLLPLAGGIRQALVRSSLGLDVGEWQKGLEFWVSPGEIVVPELKTDDFEATEVNLRRRSTEEGVLAKAETSEPNAGECTEISIAKIEVVKLSKKSARIGVTLENTSDEPIAYASLPEGLALSLFVSGSPQLSASARKVGSTDVSAALAKRDGVALLPGRKATIAIDINPRAATRYTNVLIAQFDPGQLLEECDETNNLGHTLLTE